MKKILFTFSVVGLLIIAACETPQPATDPNNNSDSTVNSNTQTDTSSTSKPDSTNNP